MLYSDTFSIGCICIIKVMALTLKCLLVSGGNASSLPLVDFLVLLALVVPTRFLALSLALPSTAPLLPPAHAKVTSQGDLSVRLF